jgi:ribonuclease D
MCREITWVKETGQLLSRLAGVGSGPLAVDTEADSMHHYPEKVCLVQLSFAEVDLLVDPLAGIDLTALQPLLIDPGLRKIMHGADYDVRMLHRDFGLEVRGLFDTMLAARLTGETAFGLAALLHKHLGITLNKKYQRADWSIRPLPEEMEAYAVMDTRHLQSLAEILQAELERLGRTEWAAEEFGRLEQVRWRETAGEEAYRRVKGSGLLNRRGLACLRELVVMREKAARKADRPPFKILSNDLLIGIARELPQSVSELAAIPRLPVSWTHGRRLDMLWEAVRTALALAESLLPEGRKRTGKRNSKPFEKRLRTLCKRRDGLASDLGIEPSLLASRAVLGQVLTNIESGESPEDVPDLRSWQAGLLRPAFEALDD